MRTVADQLADPCASHSDTYSYDRRATRSEERNGTTARLFTQRQEPVGDWSGPATTTTLGSASAHVGSPIDGERVRISPCRGWRGRPS